MIKEEKSSFEVGIKGGPNLNRDILSFIDKYVKEIKDNSAAMFIGAGFSKSAGYVDWKNLLRNVAEDLDLDIDKEYDLVSLAQYCYNKNGNRSIINDVIFDEFTKEKDVDENHRIIARLPISTYWTTNYDCNGVQREHNKKLNNGLPILHKVPPKRDYGRYFCILAEKGGTSHGGLTEKLSPFFYAQKQEVNAYGR